MIVTNDFHFQLLRDTSAVKIRSGKKQDLPRVLELVKELALFEKAPHEVINTVEQMERDGFGPNPIYGFFVAENENGIVGLSLFYWRYSTWKGKRLYLEDIIVTEKERGKKIGKLLFDRTMRHTLDESCSGMMWQVLDWNEPAINFYKKYGSKIDGEWMNCTLESYQIETILKKIKAGEPGLYFFSADMLNINIHNRPYRDVVSPLQNDDVICIIDNI